MLRIKRKNNSTYYVDHTEWYSLEKTIYSLKLNAYIMFLRYIFQNKSVPKVLKVDKKTP